MLKHDKKAYNAGWNDTVDSIVHNDPTKVEEIVARLSRIVQEATDKGKATFYHYGIQDALDRHWLGQELSAVA